MDSNGWSVNHITEEEFECPKTGFHAEMHPSPNVFAWAMYRALMQIVKFDESCREISGLSERDVDEV